MAQYMCSNPTPCGGRNASRGFTIAEVLVASVILIVGLAAVAGVVGTTLGSTQRSEYMTQAATLATEKLEDLNRFPSTDPNIAVTTGSSAGSLTSDVVQNVTVNGVTETVNYFDDVYFSPTQGSLEETESSLSANGTTQYSTTTYTPNGQVNVSTPSGSAPSTGGSIVFERRWVIEANQPVSGVRRITVLVTLLDQQVQPPVTFQMSMVRP